MLSIYKSSAGSGKTYTLVLEYLKLVILNELAYRHVLAITFTNKATEEMKDRIIRTLSELGSASSAEAEEMHVYRELKSYATEKGFPRLNIQEQARRILDRILSDYSNFSVSTIESFFQRIVRAFTRELNIPLGYDLEMEQHLVLERIVDEMFLEVGSEKELTRLLEGFLSRNLEEERSWNVIREVKELGSQIFQEKFKRLILLTEQHSSLISQSLELVKVLAEERKKFERHLERLAKEGMDILARLNLTPEDFKGKSRSPVKYFVYSLDPSRKDRFVPTATLRKVIEDETKLYSPSSERLPDIQSAISEGLHRKLADMVQYVDQNAVAYHSAGQILRTLHSFGLLDELRKRLARYRKENNQLLISDTNELLGEIVFNQFDTPFIYEKVGNRYHHYLIDEFQDTSDLQWTNLLPLIFEALGNGHGGLIVGDVKQSIYRWRNGNMNLLMEDVEQQLGPERQQVKHLANNWRTAAEIVDFNNHFFQLASEEVAGIFTELSAARVQKAYSDVAQQPMKQKIPGWVELAAFEGRKKEEWQAQALAKTVETIHQLKADGFQGKEITLLVRKNADGVRVAEYLQKEGLKVVSAESLLIQNHERVRLLMAILGHLHQETDMVAMARLSYFFSRVVEEKNEAAHAHFIRQNLLDISPELARARPQLQRLSLYECVESLLQMFPILAQPNAYVQGFLDATLEFSSRQNPAIGAFLEWWEESGHKRAIAGSPDPDAVHITTIHKSKGLEFP
ncbi:MAG: UvrD-helicase domain-containing protein, partial [Bacteroidota bacterium]